MAYRPLLVRARGLANDSMSSYSDMLDMPLPMLRLRRPTPMDATAVRSAKVGGSDTALARTRLTCFTTFRTKAREKTVRTCGEYHAGGHTAHTVASTRKPHAVSPGHTH